MRKFTFKSGGQEWHGEGEKPFKTLVSLWKENQPHGSLGALVSMVSDIPDEEGETEYYALTERVLTECGYSVVQESDGSPND